MATRYADLKFRITGGDKLQREIQAINAELKKLKNESAELKGRFAGMENSEEALTAKSKLLERQLKALEERLKDQIKYLSNAQDELERVTEARDKNSERLEKARQIEEKYGDALGENSRFAINLKDSIAQLTSNQNVLDKAVTTGTKSVQNAGAAIAKTNEEIGKTKTELGKTKQYLDEAKNSTDHCAKSINQWGEEVEKASESAQLLASAIMMSGAKAAVDALTESIKECITASAEFDQALTGVAKTTSLSGADLDAFGERLKDLATKIPLTTTELAEIAEMAGQLGIKEKDLLSFTETIAALTVSTNIMGAEGAENLARFMNIMGTVPENVDRLGASIVDLGNNFATTEDEILAMAMNLAGAGAQLNLSEADLLGIATAISSVGIAAGKGGTAFSKMLINMAVAVDTNSDKLEDFAKIAGMTAEEFSRLFKEDTIGVINEFFKGLGSGSESAIEKLTEMGVTEVRLRDTMLRLANAGDLLENAVNMSNNAFAENTALVHEANLFYGTTESQTKLLENAFNNLKIAVGDSLNPALNRLKGIATDVIKKLTEWVQANQPLVKVIVALATGLATFVGVAVTATAALTALNAIQKLLNNTMALNPYLAVAGALAALVTVITTCVLALDEADNRAKEVNETFFSIVESSQRTSEAFHNQANVIEATMATASDYMEILRKLEAQTSMTEQEQGVYNQTFEKLKNLFPDIQMEIDTTTGKIKGGTEALWEQIEAWEENAKQAAVSEYLAQYASDLTKAQIELKKTEIELENIRKKLAQTTEARKDIEALLLDELGSEKTSLALLDDEEQRRLEFLIQNSAQAKELYEQYQELQQQEKDLTIDEKAHTQAIEDQSAALEDLNEDYETSKQAVQEWSEGTKTAIENATDVDTEELGAEAVRGLERGVRSNAWRYVEAMADVARMGQNKFRAIDQTASPSKVYAQFGKYEVEGLIEGTKEQKQRLEDAYTNLAIRGQTAFTNASQTINNNSASTVNLYVQELSDDQLDRITKVVNRRLSYV